MTEPGQGQYKARLVAKGFQDRRSTIDTASPTACYEAMRVVIALVLASNQPMYQADVTKAYLNAAAPSDTTILIRPPKMADGNLASNSPFWVLLRAVYGLKDAGALWYVHIAGRLQAQGWVKSPLDPCIFTRGGALLLIYVDDFLGIGEGSKQGLHQLGIPLGKMEILNQQPHKFAGLIIHRHSNCITINVQDHCDQVGAPPFQKIVKTPLPLDLKSLDGESTTAVITKRYQHMLGSLTWIAGAARPDISYGTNQLSRHMSAPSVIAFDVLARLVEYTKQWSFHLCFQVDQLQGATLCGESDASWAAVRDNYKSTGAYIIFLANGDKRSLLVWRVKLLTRIARSSMAAELQACELLLGHLVYVHDLIKDSFGVDLPMKAATDAKDVISMVNQRKRVLPKDRTLTLTVFSVRDIVDHYGVSLDYVPTTECITNELTKPTGLDLLRASFAR